MSRLLSLLTEGGCLLRYAAQHLLSTVYCLTVDRCEARIGRVWQPYGQVYMDIRHPHPLVHPEAVRRRSEYE